MAPGILSPVPGNMNSSFYSTMHGNSRQVSALSAAFDNDSISQNGRSTRRESGFVRKGNGFGNSNITSVVQSLHRRSGDELGNGASSQLLNTSYHSIIDWIRSERMSHLPPEGSSYDKVLSWAQLFVERLHSFDLGIQDFAGDSYLAAQLSYGYCAMLLEVCFIVILFVKSSQADLVFLIQTAGQGERASFDDLLRLLLQYLVCSGESSRADRVVLGIPGDQGAADPGPG